MSITFENSRAEVATLSVEDVRQFLYREARFLDDKEWGELAGTLCAGR